MQDCEENVQESPAPVEVNFQRLEVATAKPFGVSMIAEKQVHQQSNAITLGSSRLSDYTQVSVLGKGTYGVVYKCIHNPTGQVVAMKSYLFENDKNGINYSTMREISLLR